MRNQSKRGSKRGLASADPETRRRVARMGGLANHRRRRGR